MMKRRDHAYDDEDSSSIETGEIHREVETDSPPTPQSKHFCLICKKQFSSGKAYGGHVRIHSIEYNNKGKTKKMKKSKRKSVVVKKDKEKEIEFEDKIKCCLCGKEFQTMNSLFGHMRRHPDRSWKGIRPPPPPQSDKFSLSFMDDEDSYDHNDEYDDATSRARDVIEDAREAACVLVMMKYDLSYDMSMETTNSEVISLSCYKDDKGKEKVIEDGEKKDDVIMMDDDIVDMKKIKKVINLRDEAQSRSLEIDLNHPFTCWN